MALLINQGYIRLGFMMEKKASDSMTQCTTMGIEDIIVSKFNITQGL